MPARETAARFPLPHGECGGWCGGGSAPYPRLVFGVAARPPFFSKKGEEGWGTGAATGRGNAPGKEGRDPTRSTPKRAECPPQEHTPFACKRGVRYPFVPKSREVPPPMGKQYAILRVQKCKGAAIGAMQYHNDREPGKHTNPDIDQTRTRLNREMRSHVDYEREVQARIDDGYSGERKVRKDAVKLVEGIITASPEFFEGKSEEECRRFFEDAYEFVCAEMGAENVIHFTVHMDETTPHAHWGAVPIKDGRLSWKAFFDGRGGLSAFQDRCFEKVGKPWGLDRGEKHSGRRYRKTAEMKRDLEQEVEELREQKAALIDEIAYKDGQLYELQDAVVSKEIEIEQLKSEVKRQRSTIDRLERTISGLEERLDKAVGNIIEIADTMRWRFEPQNWRKALSRLIDNPIAHAALAVRQNVARWVEKDARAADRVIKREVKSVRKELGSLVQMAEQTRQASAQLESERASGRPESRSKGIDR